jgi:hypothetical protein
MKLLLDDQSLVETVQDFEKLPQADGDFNP